MSDFKIFKYVLNGEKEQTLELPRNAQVLEIDFQPQIEGGVDLCMWALVLPDHPTEKRRIRMIDTGEPIPDEVVEKFRHVKTIQLVAPRVDEAGELVPKAIVFHLFLERGVVN